MENTRDEINTQDDDNTTGTTSTSATRSITVEDVDTRWAYRAGWPRLCPQPVTTYYSVENPYQFSQAYLKNLGSCIEDILRKHGIPNFHSGPVEFGTYRTYTHECPPGLPLERHRIIVNCIYEKETSNSTLWAEAVTEIHKAAQKLCKEDGEIGIELFDFQYMDNLEFCDFPPNSHDFVDNWDKGLSYRKKVLEKFKGYPGKYQAMMPVGLRATGTRQSDYKTVLFFDALNAEDEDWRVLEREISSVLPKDVGIEIFQAGCPLLCVSSGFLSRQFRKFRSRQFRNGLSMDDFTPPPRPGCSIGVQYETSQSIQRASEDSESPIVENKSDKKLQHERFGTGTMGGYVLTQDKDTKAVHTFGITNAHVVLGRDLKKDCILHKQAFRGDDVIKIQSPSVDVTQEHINDLRKAITMMEDDIKHDRIHRSIIMESNPEKAMRIQDRIDKTTTTLADWRHQFTTANNYQFIGTVHAAAYGRRNYGIDSFENRLGMDVALIDVSSSVSTHPEDIYLPLDLRPPEIAGAVFSAWEVDGLGNSEHAETYIRVVAKYGRTTGFSMGLVHSVKADIKFPHDKEEDTVSAWAIINPWGDDFALPGDSGAFVIAVPNLEYEGKDNRVPMGSGHACSDMFYERPFIVGLLCGMSISGNFSYFIPFDAIKDEIEALTDEKMIWPCKRSECFSTWDTGRDITD